MIKIESYKKGALLSVIFNGLAKGILFILTIIIARYFGANIKTDIYFFIYSSMALFSGFINAIDIAVLVPESMRIREKDGQAAAMYFLNYFFRIYLLVGVAFVLAMFFFGTKVFGLISKFSNEDILLYRNYFLLGSCYFFFQITINYINNILTSLKYFTIPMIISGINSTVIIGGIILLHYRFDVLSVLISGVMAYTINLIILFVILKKMAGWDFNGYAKPLSHKTWSNILYTELGQLATLTSSYFPLYLLSGFNIGILSSMGYAKNIADIPNTLVTSQLSNVSGIKLNEEIAKNDNAALSDTFLRTAKLMLFLLVPIGFFIFIFAEGITRFFYNDTIFTDTFSDTTTFLQLLSVSVFCIAVNSLVARLFIAKQAIRQGVAYQLMMNVLLLIATWLLVKKYGAYGYGYAIIAINILNYFLLYFVCKILVKEIDHAALLKYTGLIVFVNAGIATALYCVFRHWHADALPVLLVGFTTWVIILLLLNKIFHLNKDISAMIKKAKSYVN